MPVSLIDAFTRHQVYLEGYKDGLAPTIAPMLDGLYDDLTKALTALGVVSVGELTRRQLNALIKRMQSRYNTRSTKLHKKLIDELQALAVADAALNVQILEHTENTKLDDAYKLQDGAPLLGLLALRKTAKGRARLWALVNSTPDPATGQTPTKVLRTYLAYVNNTIRDTIRRAYANKWSTRELLQAVRGTRSRRYRDGVISKLTRNGMSAIHTLVQHVSSVVQAGVASIFYKYYEWVAILDKGTTKICKFRDGKIYQYRKGPLPPAHYRCRSRAVPVRKGASYQAIPDTFYGWLRLQPAAVQNDYVGTRLGGGLRSGKITAAQLGRFRTRKQLTLQEFVGKFDLIIIT